MRKISILLLIVLMITGCSLWRLAGSKNMEVEILNNEIKELAVKYNVDIIDTYSTFKNNSETSGSYYQPDGLHLSKLGYEAWLDSALIPYLDTKDFATVGMVGNSLTQGIDQYRWEGSSNSVTNWELLLKRPSKNYGIGGNTSYDILQRITPIIADSFDCYILMVGINDLNQGVPVWKCIENTEEIIKRIQASGATVVLQLVLPVIES